MGLLASGTGGAGVAVVIGPVLMVLESIIDFPVIVADFPAAVGHTFDVVKTL